MRFPLENNNGGIVKKLAKRSLAADKRRNFFILLTVTLSVCLMSIIAFYYSASRVRAIQNIRGQYQAGCEGISKTRAQELADTGFFESWGLESNLDNLKYEDATLSWFFADERMRMLDNWESITGSYPAAENEIVLERAFLEHYQLPAEIGSTISFIPEGIQKEYVLSGILERENTSRIYYVLVSDAFAARHNAGTDSYYALKFRMKNSAQLEPDILKADIAAFFDRMGIEKGSTFYSSNYFNMADLYLGTDYSVYAAALFIAIACSIVIYNIFYISVMGKMREYGRLKVIGATPLQLRQVVKRERFLLSVLSIPAGLVTGAVLVLLILPGCWDWRANIRYAVIISLLTEIVLLLSTRKPIRLAGKVSAIEAVRSTAYTAVPKRTEKQVHGHLTLYRLAAMNFSRSPKKAALTLASLGFTGILLMCIATYSSSVDLAEMAKSQLGDRADYLLSWGTSGAYENYPAIQRENPLAPAAMETLKRIPGVEEIRAYSICSVKIPLLHEKDFFNVTGLTREQYNRLIQPDHLLEGELDYEKLCSGDYVLVEESAEHLMKMLYGKQLHAGDKVKMYASNGNMREMTVLGVIRPIQTGSGGNFFILPDKVFPLFYPEIEFFTSSLSLIITEDSPALRNAVFAAVPDARVDIVSVQDLAESMRPALRSTLNGIYGLLAFIFLFALLNLVNTLITNLLSRRQEFGILQSVGMSSRQLSRMLSLECLLYIGGTLIITVVIGTAAGILICRLFSRAGIFGTLTYHFPLPQLFLFTAALLLVQGIFSLAGVRYCRRQSLVDRIKTMD